MSLFLITCILLGLSVALFGLSVVIAYHGNKKRVEANGIFADNVSLFSQLEGIFNEHSKAREVLTAVRMNNYSFRHLSPGARFKLEQVLDLKTDYPTTSFNRYRKTG